MDKKNEKSVKNDETMELTPEQMGMVSGGTGYFGGAGDNDDGPIQNNYNNTEDVPVALLCPFTPNGKHLWQSSDGYEFRCLFCHCSKRDFLSGSR